MTAKPPRQALLIAKQTPSPVMGPFIPLFFFLLLDWSSSQYDFPVLTRTKKSAVPGITNAGVASGLGSMPDSLTCMPRLFS